MAMRVGSMQRSINQEAFIRAALSRDDVMAKKAGDSPAAALPAKFSNILQLQSKMHREHSTGKHESLQGRR